MTTASASRHLIGLAAAFAVCLLASAGFGADEHKKDLSGQVHAIDFDDCDPVRMRARIMGINPVNGALIVGEREIRAIDIHAGGKPIKTVYLNPEGRPESPAAFMVGQEVRVDGMVHPEGFVAALAVQKTGAGAAAEEKKIQRKARKDRSGKKHALRKNRLRAPGSQP